MTTAQPGKRHQRLFQRAQRLDVQIIGGLVEQQHIAADLSTLARCTRLRSPPDKLADELLLLRSLEVETADIAARGGLVVAHLYEIQARPIFPAIRCSCR